jgi:hypothetical protein
MFQNSVSETGFNLRLQLKPTQLGPIDRASPYLRVYLDYRSELNILYMESGICVFTLYTIHKHPKMSYNFLIPHPKCVKHPTTEGTNRMERKLTSRFYFATFNMAVIT